MDAPKSLPTGHASGRTRPRRSLRRKVLTRGVLPIVALYLILLVPDMPPFIPSPAARNPFAWNMDPQWKELEESYLRARSAAARSDLRPIVRAEGEELARRIQGLRTQLIQPDDARLDDLQRRLFDHAVQAAACSEALPSLLHLANELRDVVKEQSTRWDLASPATRARLYRFLYGSRAAVEEAMLQAPPSLVPTDLVCLHEPAQTPSTVVHGVRIHSGDILLSRGAAPTSALIARGNDFPGNFSHVALAHVSETAQVSLIEAHIEKGVTVATVDEYLRDKKLRVMVLRPRADLPALVADPQLPHKAASQALRDATSRHIPYDFAMDFHDHSRLFCSEVASAAYERQGLTLWMGLSTISSQGLCSWLASFGVEHFLTQEPSDLEYDPQLVVVAEWRDPADLLLDHADNAIVDVLLEEAERGGTLDYSLPMLPLARTLKAYSCVLNLFEGVGPIPEGMTATAALKSEAFRKRHGALRERLMERIAAFQASNGYTPPCWQIVRLARESAR